MNEFKSIVISPSISQFFVNEFLLIFAAFFGLVIAGLDGMILSSILAFSSMVLMLVLVYRFIYLRRIRYTIGVEQLVYEHGVIQRTVDYVELYRVVDFNENQSLLQQLFGIKTVTIYSGDRTTPKLNMVGIHFKENIVDAVRQRVEYNKRRKGIYEITNR